MVRELDDLAVLEIGIIENVQRADLNILEEALSYKVLMEKFGRTQENIAQTIGKSRSHVANTLRLLALPDEVQQLPGQRRAVGRSCPRHRRRPIPAALAREIIDKGLSVRDDRGPGPQDADARPAKNKGGRPPRVKDTDTQALEADLSSVLGLDVEIDHRGGAGR
jgi:ParB family chromosome partitioning protein